jgi:hypothetical protein
LISCDGTEDLKFFFGVDDPKVQAAKDEYYEPLAFAHKETNGPQTWGKGFVWLANDSEAQKLLGSDWSPSYVLQGILIHELGHVMGCGHLNETIMREDILDFISSSIQKSESERKVMLSSVDWGDFLVTPILNFKFAGSLKTITANDENLGFKTLVGRAPNGTVSANFLRDSNNDFHLVVKDSSEEYDFKILNLQFLSWIERQGIFFKTYDGKAIQNHDPFGVTDLGQIKSKTGKLITIFIQRGGASFNNIRTPIIINFLSGDNNNSSITNILFMMCSGSISCQ